MARGKLLSKYKQVRFVGANCAVWVQWGKNAGIPKHKRDVNLVNINNQIIILCNSCKQEIGEMLAFIEFMKSYPSKESVDKIVYGGNKNLKREIEDRRVRSK